MANKRAAESDRQDCWVGQSLPHESARSNVTGRTLYLDDLPPFRNELSIELVVSPFARARIVSVDVAAAARIAGITAIFTAADVPGDNRFGPIVHDEELLASPEMLLRRSANHCSGRRDTRGARGGSAGLEARARDTASRAFDRAGDRRRRVSGPAAANQPRRRRRSTRPRRACDRGLPANRRSGALLPGDAGRPGRSRARTASITVYSSTQNPSEIQSMVAHCLGLRQNQVVCIATRMGGAFGGKESQAAHPAVIAALVAHRTGRPARLVYPRSLDMRSHGQAASLSFSLSGRLPVRRHDRRVGPRALLRRRVCLRPFIGRDGSLDPACRQRIFHSSLFGDRDGLPNESAAEYRDARIRRSAGHRRDRERGRRRRRVLADRPAARTAQEPLRRGRP